MSQQEIIEAHAALDSQNLNQLAITNAETEDNTRQLAMQLGYDGSLNPEALEAGIVDSQTRMGYELFAIGARLLLLKEQCPHGDFANRCERLGVESRLARRLMQVSAKFGNRATSPVLENFGKSKLLELVVLDDEEIKELAEGGSVRGYSADAIDKMSIKEMRLALRKAKEETEADKSATDKVLANKSAEITKLQRQLAKQNVALTDWPAQFSGYIAQAQEAHRAIQNKLGALDIIREDAMKLEAADGEETLLQQAREMLATELVHIHNSCADIIEAIGLSFDRTLGAFSEERLNAFTVPTE